MTTQTTELTRREAAIAGLCMAGGHERESAVAACRAALGRALVTLPDERANVAAYLSARGWDGLGRVQAATRELHAAARADVGLSDVAAGR